MRNIQPIIEKKKQEFAEKYYKKRFIELDEKAALLVSCAAEVWSYVENTIPEKFHKLTIFDFDGYSENGFQLSRDITSNAKNLVCKYCWGITWEEAKNKFSNEKAIKEFFKTNSVMSERLQNGTNVIVFGESATPIGRSMIASIIVKQAIKLRMLKGKKSHNYEWVDFSMLKQAIKNDSEDLLIYQNCDWLVVDDITYRITSTEKQKAYFSDLINPFFIERYRNKLPTILILKFDYKKDFFNVEECLGVGISNIINDNKTFKIPLSKI